MITITNFLCTIIIIVQRKQVVLNMFCLLYDAGLSLRAKTCNTCYGWVCLMGPWCYRWTYPWLIHFTHNNKVVTDVKVMENGVLRAQNWESPRGGVNIHFPLIPWKFHFFSLVPSNESKKYPLPIELNNPVPCSPKSLGGAQNFMTTLWCTWSISQRLVTSKTQLYCDQYSKLNKAPSW